MISDFQLTAIFIKAMTEWVILPDNSVSGLMMQLQESTMKGNVPI